MPDNKKRRDWQSGGIMFVGWLLFLAVVLDFCRRQGYLPEAIVVAGLLGVVSGAIITFRLIVDDCSRGV